MAAQRSPAPGAPDVSVVVATRDRPERLLALLSSLERQELGPDTFEVIVVEDGPGEACSPLPAESDVRLISRKGSGGPGAARNDGWKAARAPLVAFIDDDCVAAPGWLAAGLEAAGRRPGAVIQGRTEPMEAELERLGPFSHTQSVTSPGPRYQTCNIFYPRELLERLGGFDAESFRKGGEDTDLAWRAIEAGARVAWAEEARAFHAVTCVGPVGKLRMATRFLEAVQLYKRHPELRRAQLTHRVFWAGSHYLLVRALIAAALPRRWRLLRRWLARPYLLHLLERGREEGGGARHAPFFLLYDVVELATVVRGAIRYRTLVL